MVKTETDVKRMLIMENMPAPIGWWVFKYTELFQNGLILQAMHLFKPDFRSSSDGSCIVIIDDHIKDCIRMIRHNF